MAVKISIVVPFYNVEKYFEKCLLSILNQTLKEIEILCIDDCGVDSSLDICKRVMEQDPRIKLICHEKNKGLGLARNTGIESASGEYIWFLDSDDTFASPDVLEQLYDYANKYQANLVKTLTLACSFDPKLKKYVTYKYATPKKLFEEGCELRSSPDSVANLVKKYGFFCTNVLFKKEIFDNKKIRFIGKVLYEDTEFMYKVYSLVTTGIYFYNKPAFIYFKREGSIMHSFNKEKYIASVKSMVEFTYEFNKNLELLPKNKEFFSYFIFVLTNHSPNKSARKDCLEELQKNQNLVHFIPHKVDYLKRDASFLVIRIRDNIVSNIPQSIKTIIKKII